MGRRIFTYRVVALIVSICMLLLLFPSCASGGDSHELRVCIESNLYDKMSAVFNRYTELHPDVTVTYDILPNAISAGFRFTSDYSEYTTVYYDSDGSEYNEQARQQLVDRIRSETMSGYGPDLFVLNTGSIYESFFQSTEAAIAGGVFCDLLPLFEQVGISEDEFIDAVMDAGKLDGKQYIAPLDFQLMSVITSETSRAAIGDEAFTSTSSMLTRLTELSETDGFISHLFMNNYGSNRFNRLDPHYLAAEPIVDFATQQVEIDTALTREILLTGKALFDKMSDREPFFDLGWNETIGLTPWKEYVQSEDFFILTDGFIDVCQELEIIDYLLELTPEIDAFPTENGGGCAVLQSYAGIRSNSSNKANAMDMLALMLSAEFNNHPNEYTASTTDNGWSVRKDSTSERLTGIIRPKTSIICMPFGVRGFGMTPDENFRGLKPENLDKLSALETVITSARFPTPVGAKDIINRYYMDELTLDETITKLQEYWEWIMFE